MKYEEITPRTFVRLDLHAIATELRANPGMWGVIEKGTRKRLASKAFQWRSRGTAAFPRGDFEFVTRVTKRQPEAGLPNLERRVKLYGRYVGPAEVALDDSPANH